LSLSEFYKGKRLDTGEWIAGCLMIDELNPGKRYIGYLFGAEGNAAHDTDMAEVDPKSICRRADLPDVDLWENDIFEVEGERGVITYGPYGMYHFGFSIKWLTNCRYRQDIGYWFQQAEEKPRIIGNLIDLEEKKYG